MKILYFCPHQLWPMNTGARLRNFHLSNALGASCSVTLLQVLQPGEKKEVPPADATYERILSVEKEASYTPLKVAQGLLGPVPVTILNYTADSVRKYLRVVLDEGKFDAVQLESIHLFGYLAEIRDASSRPSVLLDWHNIESELMRRYAEAVRNPAKKLVAQRTSILLARSELEALKSCDAHAVVSVREREKLLRRCPSADIYVIPNGVDVSAHEFSSGRNLLFVGSMDYHANEEAVLWFARDIWPAISRRFPDMRFIIAGRNPSRTVQALASKNIQVTGTVEDIRPYYQEALAMVVPLRVGGGTRLKILEAMAAGVPVISTKLGAEGLEAKDEAQILFADTPEEMRIAVERLMEDGALRLRLRSAARKLVEENYNWAALGKQLESVHLALRSTNKP